MKYNADKFSDGLILSMRSFSLCFFAMNSYRLTNVIAYISNLVLYSARSIRSRLKVDRGAAATSLLRRHAWVLPLVFLDLGSGTWQHSSIHAYACMLGVWVPCHRWGRHIHAVASYLLFFPSSMSPATRSSPSPADHQRVAAGGGGKHSLTTELAIARFDTSYMHINSYSAGRTQTKPACVRCVSCASHQLGVNLVIQVDCLNVM